MSLLKAPFWTRDLDIKPDGRCSPNRPAGLAAVGGCRASCRCETPSSNCSPGQRRAPHSPSSRVELGVRPDAGRAGRMGRPPYRLPTAGSHGMLPAGRPRETKAAIRPARPRRRTPSSTPGAWAVRSAALTRPSSCCWRFTPAARTAIRRRPANPAGPVWRAAPVGLTVQITRRPEGRLEEATWSGVAGGVGVLTGTASGRRQGRAATGGPELRRPQRWPGLPAAGRHRLGGR